MDQFSKTNPYYRYPVFCKHFQLWYYELLETLLVLGEGLHDLEEDLPLGVPGGLGIPGYRLDHQFEAGLLFQGLEDTPDMFRCLVTNLGHRVIAEFEGDGEDVLQHSVAVIDLY